MALPFRADVDPETDGPLFAAGGDEDFGDILKPVMAGARARGVADGLEMLGAGAVLLDASGRVLHVGGRGRRLMAGWLRVVGDHLVAERPGDNRAVEDLVGGAIRGVGAELRLDAALVVRALPFATDEGPAQRLHAVLVLEEAPPG